MRIVADLHIHSKYAMATSRDTDLEHLAAGARAKGVGLLGTGDFTHPKWLAEIRARLGTGDAEGIYTYQGVRWLLSCEVSTIYQQDGRTRKIHHLLFAPDFDTVSQINDILAAHGNLGSDGRPTLTGTDSAELVDSLMSISRDVVVMPAHAWTPWFGVFGSRSGFDSLEECYGDRAKDIFAIETGLSCYDEKTQLLTVSGWKNFADVDPLDEICTLNANTGRIEYQRPTRVVSDFYSGKMYRLRTKRIDLLVTPNHKMLVTQFATRGPRPFKFKTAAEIFGRSKTFKKDGVWTGDSPRYFSLPAVKVPHGSRYYKGQRSVPSRSLPIKIWVDFLGWWVAEGHTHHGKDGDYGVYLSSSNREYVSAFLRLLRALGFNPLVLENEPGRFQVRVRNYQLYSYLRRFGESHQKFVPVEVKRLSKNLLGVFLRSYLKGDGHTYGRTGRGLSATTTSPKLRDDLMEIALKVGMSAYYKLGTPKGTPIRSLHGGRYYSSHDAWVVHFIRHNKHSVTPSTLRKYGHTEDWVKFRGRVYCVTVPNGVVYVRRDGIPVWCGNSDPQMNWRLSALDRVALVSNSDAHSPNPWRLGREANVFDLPELSYPILFGAIRKKDPSRFLFTVEVDPAYGKYHFTGHEKCGVSLAPDDAKRLKNICPKCGKKLTIGVLQRVDDLADRPEGYVHSGAIPFKRLLPLYEVISHSTGVNRLYAKSVIDLQDRLIGRFGSEFTVLLEAPESALAEVVHPKVAAAIISNREGKVKVVPGYDGVYGTPVFT